jgi:hypothetical protein
MTLRHALCTALLAALVACANRPDVGGTIQVGKVQGVFVEQYPGVFVDRRVAGDAANGKPVWVHVKFAQPLGDGRRLASALAGNELAIEPGDLVEMRLRVTAPASLEGVREHNQVTALIAKYHTEAAQRFDQTDRRALQRLTEAGG